MDVRFEIARDITENMKNRMETERIKEQYELVISGTNDGIWDWNIKTNELFLSRRWKEMLGFDDHEIKNEFASLMSLLHDDDVPGVQDYVQKYLKGEIEKFAIEFRMKHKNGSFVWILARGEALRNENGIPYRMAGSHSDITERKNAEENLRSVSEMQALLMQIALDFINVLEEDVDSAIHNSLRQLASFVSADRAYVFDYDWNNNVCNNTYEWCQEGITPEIDNLQNIPNESNREWIETHKLGQEIYIEDLSQMSPDDPSRKILEPQGIKSLLTVPLMDRDKCIGFLGFDSVLAIHKYSDKEKTLLHIFGEMLVNIANRKNLVMAKEEALRASRAKSDFLAIMSHEIRTPMNAIIGMTDLALMSDDDIARFEYLVIVKESGIHLLQVINDILDFAKIENGKLILEEHHFPIRKTFQQAERIYHLECEKAGLSLSVSLDPDIPEIMYGDDLRIRQIIINLINNAIKFTEKGGISVKAGIKRDIQLEDDEIALEITVADTGCGIPLEKQDLIFTKFEQSDMSTARKYGGTGLGLAIVKELVTMMKGHITVESTLGAGCTFNLWLVIRKGSMEQIFDRKKFIPSMGKPLNILLAEDNEVNILLATTVLERLGCSVSVARNGIEALDFLKEKNFEIVLMDIKMPKMDGIEATKQIRNGACGQDKKDVCIIGLSAHAISDIRDTGMEAGMNDYITKPIDILTLQEKIYHGMGKKLTDDPSPDLVSSGNNR